MILEANPVYLSQLSEHYTQRCLFFSMCGEKQPPSFFGKLMVPELTCGKDIVPTNFYPFTGTTKLGKKSGKLMLPIAARIWV